MDSLVKLNINGKYFFGFFIFVIYLFLDKDFDDVNIIILNCYLDNIL